MLSYIAHSRDLLTKKTTPPELQKKASPLTINELALETDNSNGLSRNTFGNAFNVFNIRSGDVFKAANNRLKQSFPFLEVRLFLVDYTETVFCGVVRS